MKMLFLVHYQVLDSHEIRMTHAVGETPDQATRELAKAGEGVWRIVSVQEMYGLIPPDRHIFDTDMACEWTGFSAKKLHQRAGEMGIPVVKDGTIMFSRRHLEAWRDRRFKQFPLFEAA